MAFIHTVSLLSTDNAGQYNAGNYLKTITRLHKKAKECGVVCVNIHRGSILLSREDYKCFFYCDEEKMRQQGQLMLHFVLSLWHNR